MEWSGPTRTRHLHGARSFQIKKFNRFDTPPAAGMFTKVPSKPTNHSKFTGKCGKPRCTACHLLPSCKSKDKTKESHKVKSRDRAAFEFAGFSATAILDHFGYS
ncbi:hypothetical protein OIU84_024903 [Salix udensis]|uniref:Uncharacterized protein n=1 Tax=Salix udensis TaxID=889485 RepID=A0AAD6PD10_9ROSI|nr:hypothetical protein OIU84_024903 [Salix udensis]